MEHTQTPWRWQGEDYRGDWGWQLLVGANGEGIIVGQDSDGPCQHLRTGMPVDPALCITGFVAAGKEHVEPVHVFEPDAAFIVRACNSHDVLVEMLGLFIEQSEAVGSVAIGDIEKAKAVLAKAKE